MADNYGEPKAPAGFVRATYPDLYLRPLLPPERAVSVPHNQSFLRSLGEELMNVLDHVRFVRDRELMEIARTISNTRPVPIAKLNDSLGHSVDHKDVSALGMQEGGNFASLVDR